MMMNRAIRTITMMIHRYHFLMKSRNGELPDAVETAAVEAPATAWVAVGLRLAVKKSESDKLLAVVRATICITTLLAVCTLPVK